MKKFKILVITSVILACIFPLNISAECMDTSTYTHDNVEEKEFRFRDFSYKADDIPVNTYTVYVADESKETYYVYENGTNTLVDTITVEYGTNYTNMSVAANPDAHDALFTRDKTISANGIILITIRFTASVKYYSSGSFRSFEGLNYTNLAVVTCASTSWLENSSSSASPHGGSYPTTQLDFTYVTNVVSEISHDFSIDAAFISAGFSKSYRYYKYVSSSGSFNLY